MVYNHLWEKYCNCYRRYSFLGLSLDTSRVNFPENYAELISDKVSSAFSAMQSLEKGEIANPDENRMVGHYWLRNPELAPTEEISNAIKNEIQKVSNFVNDSKHKTFKTFLFIGIGGSALGAQLLTTALQKDSNTRSLFIDNTDPNGIHFILEQIKDSLSETLCIVSSKSGGTIETRNGLLAVKEVYKNAGLDFSNYAAAITIAGSELDREAENWLEQFYIWDWVGGRTSIFSAVGLLPLALNGLDTEKFLSGASSMDQLTRQNSPENNPAMQLALCWHHTGEGEGKKDMVVLPYRDSLVLFSKYLQQLIMESIGKEKDLHGRIVNQGLTVYGNKGSTDQHALVQQLKDGIDNFFVNFIEVIEDKKKNDLEIEKSIQIGDYLAGFLQGTRAALTKNKRESITISLDSLNEKTLGALIALFERAVGYYASLININAYNQPGVEAGKKEAKKVISLQQKLVSEIKAGECLTAEEVAKKIGAIDNTELVFKTLERLALNGRGVEISSTSNSPKEIKFTFLKNK